MSTDPTIIRARKGEIVAVERVDGASRWSLGIITATALGMATKVLPAGEIEAVEPVADRVRFFGMPAPYRPAAHRVHGLIVTEQATYDTAEALRIAIVAQHAALTGAA